MDKMEMYQRGLLAVKAKLLCEGANPDQATLELFAQQNPSGVKRGGLSSGGKLKLGGRIFVNAPFYLKREVGLGIQADLNRVRGVSVIDHQSQTIIVAGEVLPAPSWYNQRLGEFAITQIITAHNRQLAAAVYEDCVLFGLKKECRFCVMNVSQRQKSCRLMRKSAELILGALELIPVSEYGGLTLNGGMTLAPGRGMEIFEPVVRQISQRYPGLPIAVEITPPADLGWINRLAEAGVSSLMMNLETWDLEKRREIIPGKDELCPRDLYLRAFARAVGVLGSGKVSTCFVVGTESLASLREGIRTVVQLGVIPSPLAGRYFEDVPEYRFSPQTDWRDFLEIIYFTADQLRQSTLATADQAGCVACGMCDLIKEVAC